MEHGYIAVLDFGGQYAHLLARRVRECGAFSVIVLPETKAEHLRGAAGMILSGGPQSVYDAESPQADHGILELGVPILGICYGHQWIAHVLGGKVCRGKAKEYGEAVVRIQKQELRIMRGFPEKLTVWMSHGDTVMELPMGFRCVASSKDCSVAAMADERRRIFGLQFHPEVTHTEYGQNILRNFVGLCDVSPWSPADALANVEKRIREDVGDWSVFMLVSGGVDSTVAFALLNRVLGPERVQGLLINTGLMRKGEVAAVRKSLEHLGYRNIHSEDASDDFFHALAGVVDPEEKRRIIGETFLMVQQRVSERFSHHDTWLLGQGTIYPDTIETGGTTHADRIKTHHNRVPAIQAMIDAGRIIEPLKELYKDEVRQLGEILGLPHALVWRQPFPGPGLGVRILCTKGQDQEETKCHSEPVEERYSVPSFDELKMTPHTILPICSVGVQGDERTYRQALVLFSPDRCPHKEHWRLATDIPNRDVRFNRVLLCTSHTVSPPIQITSTYVTRETADLLREANALVDGAVHRHGLLTAIWQFPVVLLPCGIHVGGRSIVLRPVASREAMTAEAFHFSSAFLEEVTQSLLKISGIDMVFYDLTSKPPATIEWE